ncbi:BMC domain-containing protein [Pseudonocardia acaciae]|uniref:BMC domain-containing protein n=1 Tax=Pseudonocardia acaciae TaxID=551276 RepID=UPI00048AC84D|nr:BMC domain-containing protein [Pseudonocardia acaciae]
MASTERARGNAIGLIETRGIVALTAGIEAMIKTADVQCIAVDRVSSGYLIAAIQGQLAAVRQALDAGSAAVKRYGELRAAQLYPRPSAESSALLETHRAAALQNAVLALPSGDGR